MAKTLNNKILIRIGKISEWETLISKRKGVFVMITGQDISISNKKVHVIRADGKYPEKLLQGLPHILGVLGDNLDKWSPSLFKIVLSKMFLSDSIFYINDSLNSIVCLLYNDVRGMYDITIDNGVDSILSSLPMLKKYS